MIDSHRLGIAELRAGYTRGSLSPRRVVDDMLRRIDQLDPRLRAYIQIDHDGARAAAEESEKRYSSDDQRPLEGVPMGIKANIAVAGFELSAGMDARRGIVAEQDATAVKTLRDAGVIILGTLNMHEAALGAVTDNPFFGRCLNPHGEVRSPGGSSGGSAAAVAAGLCTAALGTDTLGSIRIPASYCGVFGLKPTHKDAVDPGLVQLSAQFDTIGPLARSMDDISFLSNIMFAPDLSSAMQRARFLTLTDLGGVIAQPDVLQAYHFALGLLPQQPEAITLPYECSRIRTAGFATATRDLARSLVELGPERCSRISAETERLIDFGINRSPEDAQEDADILAATSRALRSVIGDNGILVLPTAPQTAFAHGERAPHNQADWTALANIAGLPAISIPIGRTPELLPIGLQLIGPAGGEALLIAQTRAINDRLKAYAPPIDWW